MRWSKEEENSECPRCVPGREEKLIRALFGLVMAVVFAGGAGYSIGAASAPRAILQLEDCEQQRPEGDISVYYCGDTLVFVVPR